MNLFTPDLFRNFALGFALGGVILAVSSFDLVGSTLDAPANAAAPLQMPQPSDEFAIAPLKD